MYNKYIGSLSSDNTNHEKTFYIFYIATKNKIKIIILINSFAGRKWIF